MSYICKIPTGEYSEKQKILDRIKFDTRMHISNKRMESKVAGSNTRVYV